jgi:hypothetical protein
MKTITVYNYNPQKPQWYKSTGYMEFDAQINHHNAIEFNANGWEAALKIAKQYGAYKLTQFAKARIMRSEYI